MGALDRKKYILSKTSEGIYLQVIDDSDLLFPVTLEQLFADLKRRNINFDPQYVESCFETAGPEGFKISLQLDKINDTMQFKIRVTPDQQRAYLLAVPFINGTPVTKNDIESALESERIRVGIKYDVIDLVLQQPDKYHEWLIAEGTDCTDGENARLIYNFNPAGLDIKPTELENGSVDFYNLNLIQVVAEGTVIIEKVQATKGINGKNVYGEEKTAKPGKDIRLPVGRNTQAIDDNSKIVATTPGHVVLISNKVCVLPTFEVKGDVDFSTGNIKFPGNVIITGDVKNGFEVEASGDIEIFGNLEGTVNTENNLNVKKGIIRGKAYAKGSIFTRHIENSNIESHANINVSEAIMHSNVKAEKQIIVGGKRGLIVGGNVCAGESIKAKNVGSNLGTSTNMEIGIRPEAREEYKEVCRRLPILLQESANNEKVIKALQEIKQKTGALTGGKNEMFLRACRSMYQYRQDIEALTQRKDELELQFEKMDNARLSVEQNIYTGVNIVMGKDTFRVIEELRYATFKLEGYEIKLLPFSR